MTKFKNSYIWQDGDVCVRRIGEDRYEVSEWVGDIQNGEWHDRKPVSLAELNKFIRIHEFLGTNNAWEYYRPASKQKGRQ